MIYNRCITLEPPVKNPQEEINMSYSINLTLKLFNFLENK